MYVYTYMYIYIYIAGGGRRQEEVARVCGALDELLLRLAATAPGKKKKTSKK
jgi:hypothetical protein